MGTSWGGWINHSEIRGMWMRGLVRRISREGQGLRGCRVPAAGWRVEDEEAEHGNLHGWMIKAGEGLRVMEYGYLFFHKHTLSPDQVEGLKTLLQKILDMLDYHRNMLSV